MRINTNGHANLILGRDVVPELKGRIDTLSISLNAVTAAEYTALCHPAQGEAAYQAMLDFAREATRYVPHVVLTIVDKDKSSAAFYAHQKTRKNYYQIGVELANSGFEYFAGGEFQKVNGDGTGPNNHEVAAQARAEKTQVQFMVKTMLHLAEVPKPDDTADALAAAICRGHSAGRRDILKRIDILPR